MLLDLEATGQEVYYSAPMFPQPDELNAAFLANSVRCRSVWIRPSDIGSLPDDGDHHVSFEADGPWTLFSQPKRLNAKREFETVIADLHRRLRERGKLDLGQGNLEYLAAAIADIAGNGTI
jgi:hypothetical protein